MMKKAIEEPQKDVQRESGETSARRSTEEIWTLEEVFPQAGELLSPSKPASAADDDVLVVLDTNALLLPFRVGTQDLPKIEEVYGKLIESKRLFVPARSIREFIKNRDGRLAEIIKTLRDRASTSNVGGVEIPPLLKDLPETRSLSEMAEKLKSARKDYLDANTALVTRILDWRGDDPVTSVYHKLFTKDVVIEVDEDREVIEKNWEQRLRKRIPPGYKDGSKSDTGIGDFLIWLVLLKLGTVHKKSLIFVTGEEKADWYVRADGEGVYPRPELVDEFRRASNGQHLHLFKLADVLSDMKAPAEVVQEVRQAEAAANVAVQLAGLSVRGLVGSVAISGQSGTLGSGQLTFDYSTNDGTIVVGKDSSSFQLSFSKAGDDSIHFYRNPSTPLVARAKNVRPGEVVAFESFDSSSRVYTIQVGETFLARNMNDLVLVGRIHHIADDTCGAPHDEVTFSYRIFGPGERIVAP